VFTSTEEECSQETCLSKETKQLNLWWVIKSDLNEWVFSKVRHRQE